MFDRVITGDIVTPDHVIAAGYVAISGGIIRAIGAGELPPCAELDEFRDCLIFPGLVDAQVHAGSCEGIAGLADATRAAAAGGVTTIVDMPFDDPLPVNDLPTFEAKVQKIRDVAVVDVGLYVTAPKTGESETLRALADAGACAVKVSTYEYHPVRFPRFSTGEMYEVFSEAAGLGLPVAFHNEDQELVSHFLQQARARGDTSPAAHGRSRPPIAELVANAQILELASHTGVRCHIVHSSVPGGFELVQRYRGQGYPFTAETCIQYLVFTEDDMEKQGAFLKQNPPLRAAREREALWECLANDLIDIVSTDHVAWPETRKSDPDIFENGAGVPGLETLLPVFYTSAVAHRGLSPCVIARVASLNPARHFGLYPRKGRIAVGSDADIAVLRRTPARFDQRKMISAVKWSPYEGFELAASVIATFVRGVEVFRDKSIRARPGYGQFVSP